MLLNGLIELAFEAHEELEHEHMNFPYNPDWEAYQRGEENNVLRFISLREDSNLIGYASIVMDTEIHHSGLKMAFFRDIYVTKSKRGYAAKLVRFAEKALSGLGVVRIQAGKRISANNHAGKFYEALGYEPQEIIYGKTIN